MKKWLIAALCAGTLCAQSSGRVTGRIVGQGAGPLQGDVLVVSSSNAVRLNSVTTDDRGAFTIDLPAGPVLLVARADGYVSEERPVLVRAGAANPAIQFVLAQAGSISGRVFDENGAGVAGARVWVSYRGEARAWRVAEETGGEAADQFGYFTIPVVAQGRPFVLHAESEGRLPSSSGTLVLRALQMQGVVLLLSRRGTVVRGRALDASGNPVAGATVRLRALPGPAEFTAEQRASIAFARGTNKTAVTGADGAWAFEGVPTGRVVVTADSAGRRGSGEAETAPGRVTEVNLTLR